MTRSRLQALAAKLRFAPLARPELAWAAWAGVVFQAPQTAQAELGARAAGKGGGGRFC